MFLFSTPYSDANRSLILNSDVISASVLGGNNALLTNFDTPVIITFKHDVR